MAQTPRFVSNHTAQSDERDGAPRAACFGRRQRVRRALILCCHFLRNLAFYRAGWRGRVCIRKDQFWVTANGNFLDHCVLEWCKLFADEKRGKHFWRKVITDQEVFLDGLLRTLKFTEAEFASYVDEMRTYRDKFVAHLDLDEVMQIPRLRLAQKGVSYLHDYILEHEDDGGFFPEVPPKASRFFSLYAGQGKEIYAK